MKVIYSRENRRKEKRRGVLQEGVIRPGRQYFPVWVCINYSPVAMAFAPEIVDDCPEQIKGVKIFKNAG